MADGILLSKCGMWKTGFIFANSEDNQNHEYLKLVILLMSINIINISWQPSQTDA